MSLFHTITHHTPSVQCSVSPVLRYFYAVQCYYLNCSNGMDLNHNIISVDLKPLKLSDSVTFLLWFGGGGMLATRKVSWLVNSPISNLIVAFIFCSFSSLASISCNILTQPLSEGYARGPLLYYYCVVGNGLKDKYLTKIGCCIFVYNN